MKGQIRALAICGLIACGTMFAWSCKPSIAADISAARKPNIPAGRDDQRVADGFRLLNEYKPDRAIASLTGPYIEALAANDRPRAARYLLLIATGFRFDENLPACLEAARMALSLDPESVRAKTMVADSLVRLGRYDEAEAQLKPLEPLLANDELVARSWGNLYATEGDAENAQKYLSSAARLDPSDPRPLFGLAKLPGIEHAADYFRKAAQVTPSPYLAELYLWLAERETHRHVKDGSQINKEHLTKAAAILPDEPSWRTSLVWQMMGEGKEKEAYNLMLEAMQCKRFYWRAYTQFTVYCMYHKRQKDAERCVQFLMQAQPQAPEVYYTAGQVAAYSGHSKLAEDRFEQALKMNPRLTLAYQGLSQLSDYSVPGEKQTHLISEWTKHCSFAADAWLFKGRQECKQKQWAAALASYKRAAELLQRVQNDDRYSAQLCQDALGAGVASYKLNDVPTALKCAVSFNKLKIEDTSTPIKVRPGKVNYGSLSGTAKAGADHGLIADMLFEMGLLDDCINEYKQAIEEDGANIDWHRGLLKAYMDNHNYSDAAKEDIIVANHTVTKDIPASLDKLTKRFSVR